MVNFLDVVVEIEALKNSTKQLKEDFEKVIKDKNIPLHDRWNLFVSAPSSLKNTGLYAVHFKSLPEDAIMYEGDIYHAERYAIVDMLDVVCSYEEIVDESDETYTPEVLISFKEEILSMNLGSYQYDW